MMEKSSEPLATDDKDARAPAARSDAPEPARPDEPSAPPRAPTLAEIAAALYGLS